MTMVCLLNRIRPNYLFIYVSTTCDEKKSGYLRINGIYLRSDMSRNEWEMGLWGEQPVALYAAVLAWNVLGLTQWPSLYDMLTMLGVSGPVHWFFGLGLTVQSSKSWRHRVCRPRLSICTSIACLMFWSIPVLIDSNVVNVCVSVQCVIGVFSVCVLYCDI